MGYYQTSVAKRVDRSFGTVIKHRIKNGKHTFAKVQNLPTNVFIWNKEILSDNAVKEISTQLDYDYYIKRIYERINEFL